MPFLFALIVITLIYVCSVNCVRHHLLYMYTTLTKPDGFSGPVFSAVGLCDDRQISHYNNEEGTWKRHCLDPEIWRDNEEPDVSRDWFLHLVNTLANCTSSRCDGLHTLQRRIGCEVYRRPDGSVLNLNVFDEYGYNGEDFITFDIDTMQWKDKSQKAKETKMKWDANRSYTQHLKLYLKRCMDWISTFNASINSPPALHMFTSRSPRDQSELNLTCLATGFYPKHIEMNITLNNLTLQPFSSTGVRPNDNQTFQIRTSVKIHRDEKQSYECRVLHSGQTVTSSWDGSLKSRQHGLAAVAAGAFGVAVVVLIMFVIYRRLRPYQPDCNSEKRTGGGDPGSSTKCPSKQCCIEKTSISC